MAFTVEQTVAHSLPFVKEGEVYLVVNKNGVPISVAFADLDSATEARRVVRLQNPETKPEIVVLSMIRYQRS